MHLLIATLAILAVIVCSEYILWRLFSRKAQDLSLPHELDASALRFFSIHRMRFLVLAHTGFVAGASLLVLWWLW